jgi:hypothetical protein
MIEERDWVIMNMSFSKDKDYLQWNRSGDSGYTDDLMQACRYTLTEANELSEGDSNSVGLPLSFGLAASSKSIKVETSEKVITMLLSWMAQVAGMEVPDDGKSS